MRRTLRSLLFLFVFLSPVSGVYAQFETAEVLGTVRDASGASVPAAKVTLTNVDTGIQSTTTTDELGNYDFFSVKVGRYSIDVEVVGFSKTTVPNVSVSVNARQRVDVSLQLAGVSEIVEVTDAAATLETDSSEHGQIITPTAIVELPLNGRNYSDLALLSTNTIKSPIAISFSPSGTPREGAFNVNGMRSTFNNFLLDGMDNNAYGPSNQGYSSQVVQPSPDALAEFKVITSNYSAEYGRVGGAVVNAVTRSGTNQFHGTAYEFLRNTALNAKGFQFSPGFKPTLQRNQFGLTVGGPFIKSKVFFFADYEGFRQLQRYLNFDTLPNLNDRNGILPVSVVNPLTGVLYSAGTQIPIASLNPFAATALTGLPTPNGPGRSNNFQALILLRDYSDKFDAKLDGQINDTMRGFVRYSQRKDIQYYAPSIPGPSGGDGNGFIHAIDQNASIGLTWTPTSSSILDARFGFTHVLAGKNPPYIGGPSAEALYGFKGLPTTPNLTGGIPTQTISGFNDPTMGRQTSNPQFQNPTSFNPKINYSWIRGGHAFKAGFEFLDIRTEVLDVNPLYGQDIYNGQFSKPTCAQLGQPGGCTVPADPTSYNLADFIFGVPAGIKLGNNFVSNMRQHVTSLYFQDDWRMTPKLTLNLGLRYEFATPVWERDNHYANFDPTTNTMAFAKPGDLFNRSLAHPDRKDFGPRIGAAYSVEAKTVVRAGYGISYTFFNRPGSAQEALNSPFANFAVLNQTMPQGGPAPATFLTTLNSFSTGIADAANFNPANFNVVYAPPDARWPYIQNWFFSVQREISKTTVVEIAYNGNHALRLQILGDYNQAAPNLPGQTLGVQARRPIPTFGPITWVDPAGNNHYDGFSTRLEHRFAAGLYFLNSFTWSKAIGNSEQALESYAGYYVANPQNIRNLGQEKGPTSFDVKLNNVTSLVYQLPFGKGRRFVNKMNPILDGVLGGWDINSIITAHTGTPLDVVYAPPTANDVTGLSNDYRGQAFQRPNVSGSAASQSRSQMLNTYYAGYTFATPPASAPFGNVGRNSFRSPGYQQWDLAINKNFPVRESVQMQFRSEFFNVLNHTNFGIPNSRSTDAAFGTIRSTYPPRQIQFALKLVY